MSEQLYDHDAIGQRQRARQIAEQNPTGWIITVYETSWREAEADLTATRAEVEQLAQWVNDLQAGCFINCVYCGHRYGPDPGTPVAMADVLKAHIEQCPQHPMSQLKAEHARLVQERSELIEQTYRLGEELAQEKIEKVRVRQELDEQEERIAVLEPPASSYNRTLKRAEQAEARLAAMRALVKGNIIWVPTGLSGATEACVSVSVLEAALYAEERKDHALS